MLLFILWDTSNANLTPHESTSKDHLQLIKMNILKGLNEALCSKKISQDLTFLELIPFSSTPVLTSTANIQPHKKHPKPIIKKNEPIINKKLSLASCNKESAKGQPFGSIFYQIEQKKCFVVRLFFPFSAT